jgi:hypothetical protein
VVGLKGGSAGMTGAQRAGEIEVVDEQLERADLVPADS